MSFCKARHFSLCSTDTDKTFLSKTSPAILSDSQVLIWSRIQESSDLLILKKFKFCTPTFLKFSQYFQRSEHCWLHAARQQPDKSHTTGDQDSEGGGKSKHVQTQNFLLGSRLTTRCTCWMSVRRPSCSLGWTSTPPRASRTSRISMMRPST